MNKKRFTEEEKNFLLVLIEKYKCIVENKGTDGDTLQQKRSAWCEIQEIFNSVPDHTERTVVQLQKCWDNMKTKRKRELAATKRAMIITGGESVPVMKGECNDPIHGGILNATNVEMESWMDSDTVMLLSSGSEPNSVYKLTDKSLETIQPPVSIDEPTAATLASGEEVAEYNDLSDTSEQRSFGSRKRKFLTEQQAAINSELEAQMKKMSQTTEARNELHEIRREEAEARYKIALEDLKEAKVRTETAKLKQEFERQLGEMKIAFARVKHQIDMISLFDD